MPIVRGRLRGKKWIVGSGAHGCWLGTYESQMREAFEDALESGDTVFDVGAHVGYYTLLAAEIVGPSGLVVAFEPLPSNLDYLRAHLQLNDITNAIFVEAAVSDRASFARFDDTGGSYSGRLLARSEEGVGIEVSTVALDQWTRGERVGLPCVLNIDVEGAETAVLTGARHILGEARPTVFLATHGREQHRDCCELLSGMGYTLRSAITGGPPTSANIIAEHIT